MDLFHTNFSTVLHREKQDWLRISFSWRGKKDVFEIFEILKFERLNIQSFLTHLKTKRRNCHMKPNHVWDL